MKLTIIPSDNAVYKNGECYLGLDLSNVPTNIHALQWYETEGEIELINNLDRTKPQNEIIFELPVWVDDCLSKWNEAKIVHETGIAANQPQTGLQTA